MQQNKKKYKKKIKRKPHWGRIGGALAIAGSITVGSYEFVTSDLVSDVYNDIADVQAEQLFERQKDIYYNRVDHIPNSLYDVV